MKKKKRILCVLGIAGILLAGMIFCFFCTQLPVHAAGLVEDVVDDANLYSRYPLKNYQLDFYVDNSWGWLPWKWLGTARNGILYGIYALTNVLWTFSCYLSSGTGYAVQEAYQLDFIGDMADKIGANIQTLAGISPRGFSSNGLYLRLLPWVTVIVGVHAGYHGLMKKEASKALHSVINFLVIFVFSAVFIAYSPDYIKKINEFSSDMSEAVLEVSAKITMPGSETEGGDSVALIRDSLFAIQVYQPWLLLQYGTTDTEAIGNERVERLLPISPSDSEKREEAVKTEITENGNQNLSAPEVGGRFGMVLFLLIFNIGISVFVFILVGIMILSQILFIVFGLFLPVSFLVSMIPGQQGKWKQAVIKVFNTVILRSGITLVITIAFSISSMLYSMTTGYPFFLVAFLQIVVFAGIYWKMGDLLGMFNLHSTDSENMGRRMFGRTYRQIRYRTMRSGNRRWGMRRIRPGRQAGTAFDRRANVSYTGNMNRASDDMGQSRTVHADSHTGQRGMAGRRNTAAKAGRTVGKLVDVPAKAVDIVKRPVEKAADLPANLKYGFYSAKEGVKQGIQEGKENRQNRQEERRLGKEYKRQEMEEAKTEKKPEQKGKSLVSAGKKQIKLKEFIPSQRQKERQKNESAVQEDTGGMKETSMKKKAEVKSRVWKKRQSERLAEYQSPTEQTKSVSEKKDDTVRIKRDSPKKETETGTGTLEKRRAGKAAEYRNSEEKVSETEEKKGGRKRTSVQKDVGIKSGISEKKAQKVSYQNRKEEKERLKQEKWNELGEIPKGAVLNRSVNRQPRQIEWTNSGKQQERDVVRRNTVQSVKDRQENTAGKTDVQRTVLPERPYRLRVSSYIPVVKEKDGKQRVNITRAERKTERRTEKKR